MASQARAAVETGRARAGGTVALRVAVVRPRSPYRARAIIARRRRCLHFWSRGLSRLSRFVPFFYGFVPILTFRNFFCFKNALIEFAVLLLLQSHEVGDFVHLGGSFASRGSLVSVVVGGRKQVFWSAA